MNMNIRSADGPLTVVLGPRSVAVPKHLGGDSMAAGRKGFTLIELLVVLVIIGALAPMVVPVFARTYKLAREARCLANVKNVALAIQMYLADNNDTLPPMETSPRVLDWFAANAPNWPSAATDAGSARSLRSSRLCG
jgi:prepilin-type N-terminal cleavage/methylation domain-containing protein